MITRKGVFVVLGSTSITCIRSLLSYRFVRCGETLFGKAEVLKVFLVSSELIQSICCSCALFFHHMVHLPWSWLPTSILSIPKKLGPPRNITQIGNSMYSGMDSYLYEVHDVVISIGMWAFATNRWSRTQMWKMYILYHVPLKQS